MSRRTILIAIVLAAIILIMIVWIIAIWSDATYYTDYVIWSSDSHSIIHVQAWLITIGIVFIFGACLFMFY